jgi:hypothetical protein
MKMLTRSFNQLRELNEYVNQRAIPKRNIVNIFQSTDGTFQLIYYDED